MIKIEVDEAYAYDMLSVLEIKCDKINFGRQPFDNYYNLQECIANQVGRPKHTGIVMSKEFQRLLDVNLKIFERIDELKKRIVWAKDAVFIDKMNYERYLAKKALQEKFFPEQKITEQKIGY